MNGNCLSKTATRAALGVAVLAWAATGSLTPAAAQVPPTPPVFPRLANAVSTSHAAVPVPPGLEIEVLDPNADPRGNPAVVTRVAAILTPMGPEARTFIDIPPTVLVHKYYYTGDRSFRAPLLTGGPCVVVFNNPKTGERVYAPAQLPPGSPRVIYTAGGIEYDYGNQGVTITMCGLFHQKPKVTYRQGATYASKVEHVSDTVLNTTRALLVRTTIPECTDKAVVGVKNTVVATVDGATTVTKALLAPPAALIQATPIGSVFTRSPADNAASARSAELQRATNSAIRAEDSFLPTNR